MSDNSQPCTTPRSPSPSEQGPDIQRSRMSQTPSTSDWDTDSDRSQLDRPREYSVQVKAISTDEQEHSWIVQSGLVFRHSANFRSEYINFGVDDELPQIRLKAIAPDTFQMLVEFIETEQYNSLDDLGNHHKTRCSAELWVLADYLGPKRQLLQEFAIRDLFNTFGLEVGTCPKTGVAPAMIRFVCSETDPDSPIYQMTLAFCIRNWSHQSRVVYARGDRPDWEEVWRLYPHFSNELLFRLNQPDEVRWLYGSDLLYKYSNCTDEDDEEVS